MVAMPAVILSVLEHPLAAPAVLAAARCLAERVGATLINALAIRVPPIETILRTEEILSRKNEARIRARESARSYVLKAAFDAWSSGREPGGPIAAWHDIEARADQTVTEWGRRADFVVLQRPWPQDTEPDRLALHAALFETGRPVLVVPPEQAARPFGRSIAIAWRNEARTVKTVLAAMHLIGQAGTVHVLAGVREGVPAPRLPDILEEHNMAAQLHVLPITGQDLFGQLLLAKAHELACDMIVMGAFARHPIHSLVLGGVTRHMLAHADLPAFMRH